MFLNELQPNHVMQQELTQEQSWLNMEGSKKFGYKDYVQHVIRREEQHVIRKEQEGL